MYKKEMNSSKERVWIKDLNKLDKEYKVTIQGWCTNIRDAGKITFFQFRDITGTIQILQNEHTKFNSKLVRGCVYKIEGLIQLMNSKLELVAHSIENLSIVEEEKRIDLFSEETKLKERTKYIKYQAYENILRKNRAIKILNDFFYNHNFCTIHTPMLTIDSTTGANLFKVHGKRNEYALPQSPQIYKQLVISSGVERYYQIASCFRDEDLRNDRQPEFIQVDFEMAFCSETIVMKLVEDFIAQLLSEFNLYDLRTITWSHLTYTEAMDKYGVDAPFIFDDVILKEEQTYFYFDIPESLQNIHHDKLLLWQNEINGIQIKFVIDKYRVKLYDTKERAGIAMRQFLKMFNKDKLSFCWVTDFPMFTYEDNQIYSTHNPFTASKDDKGLLNGQNVNSRSYDLVLNGCEVLGGSIRIHAPEIQSYIFDKLGIQEEMKSFMKLFDNFLPIHGGAALGLDRLLSELFFASSIREFIFFPKASNGKCLFLN